MSVVTSPTAENSQAGSTDSSRISAQAAADSNFSTAHIPVLDAARGVAVMLVVSYHWMQCYLGLPVHGLLVPLINVFDIGWAGVDLFFVLSGFLITRILLAARGKPNGMKNFYVRRALRIFPVYYIALIVVLLLVPQPAREQYFRVPPLHGFNAWAPWLYLTNVAQSFGNTCPWIYGSLDHFWSLAVEEHYYWFWPLMVFTLSRQSLTLASVALIFATILARIIFGVCLDNGAATYLFTPCRLDGLLMGSLLAIAYTGGVFTNAIGASANAGSVPRKRWNVFFAACVLIGLPLGWYIRYHPDPVGTQFMYTCFSTGFTGFLALLVLNQENLFVKAFNNPVLRFFGLYSYGLYAYHHLVRPPLIPVTLFYSADHANAAAMSYGALHLALALGISMLSYHFIEKKFLKLKEKFS